MNKLIPIAGVFVVFFIILFLGFVHRGNTIEKLTLELNGYILELSIQSGNVRDLNKTLTKQNDEICKLRVDLQTANESLSKQKPIIIEKCNTKIKTIYVQNST